MGEPAIMRVVPKGEIVQRARDNQSAWIRECDLARAKMLDETQPRYTYNRMEREQAWAGWRYDRATSYLYKIILEGEFIG